MTVRRARTAEKIVVAERHVTAAVISYCTLPPLAA
jgi:hypothetical protein